MDRRKPPPWRQHPEQPASGASCMSSLTPRSVRAATWSPNAEAGRFASQAPARKRNCRARCRSGLRPDNVSRDVRRAGRTDSDVRPPRVGSPAVGRQSLSWSSMHTRSTVHVIGCGDSRLRQAPSSSVPHNAVRLLTALAGAGLPEHWGASRRRPGRPVHGKLRWSSGFPICKRGTTRERNPAARLEVFCYLSLAGYRPRPSP